MECRESRKNRLAARQTGDCPPLAGFEAQLPEEGGFVVRPLTQPLPASVLRVEACRERMDLWSRSHHIAILERHGSCEDLTDLQ